MGGLRRRTCCAASTRRGAAGSLVLGAADAHAPERRPLGRGLPDARHSCRSCPRCSSCRSRSRGSGGASTCSGPRGRARDWLALGLPARAHGGRGASCPCCARAASRSATTPTPTAPSASGCSGTASRRPAALDPFSPVTGIPWLWQSQHYDLGIAHLLALVQAAARAAGRRSLVYPATAALRHGAGHRRALPRRAAACCASARRGPRARRSSSRSCRTRSTGATTTASCSRPTRSPCTLLGAGAARPHGPAASGCARATPCSSPSRSCSCWSSTCRSSPRSRSSAALAARPRLPAGPPPRAARRPLRRSWAGASRPLPAPGPAGPRRAWSLRLRDFMTDVAGGHVPWSAVEFFQFATGHARARARLDERRGRGPGRRSTARSRRSTSASRSSASASPCAGSAAAGSARSARSSASRSLYYALAVRDPWKHTRGHTWNVFKLCQWSFPVAAPAGRAGPADARPKARSSGAARRVEPGPRSLPLSLVGAHWDVERAPRPHDARGASRARRRSRTLPGAEAALPGPAARDAARRGTAGQREPLALGLHGPARLPARHRRRLGRTARPSRTTRERRRSSTSRRSRASATTARGPDRGRLRPVRRRAASELLGGGYARLLPAGRPARRARRQPGGARARRRRRDGPLFTMGEGRTKIVVFSPGAVRADLRPHAPALPRPARARASLVYRGRRRLQPPQRAPRLGRRARGRAAPRRGDDAARAARAPGRAQHRRPRRGRRARQPRRARSPSRSSALALEPAPPRARAGAAWSRSGPGR